MCAFCSAHKAGALSWMDFSFDAGWRKTCRTHQRFLADMRLSKAKRFRRGPSPFKRESLLTMVPFFSWTTSEDGDTTFNIWSDPFLLNHRSGLRCKISLSALSSSYLRLFAEARLDACCRSWRFFQSKHGCTACLHR
jgi:hypothetical protein